MINETESVIKEAAEVGRVMTIRYRVQGLSHMLCWIILILPPILKEDAVPHLTDEENIVPGG